MQCADEHDVCVTIRGPDWRVEEAPGTSLREFAHDGAQEGALADEGLSGL